MAAPDNMSKLRQISLGTRDAQMAGRGKYHQEGDHGRLQEQAGSTPRRDEGGDYVLRAGEGTRIHNIFMSTTSMLFRVALCGYHIMRDYLCGRQFFFA